MPQSEDKIVKLSDLKKETLLSKQKIKPLLISIDEGIIKVSGQTTKTYIGYNIFTNTLMEVEKEKCSNIPRWVIHLLGNKVSRFDLALLIENNNAKEAAKIVKTNEREMYRFKASKLIKK